jgi:hypothetical protein
MASIIARRAFSTTARRLATGEEALKTESKKNPEIMVRQIPTATPDPPLLLRPLLQQRDPTTFSTLDLFWRTE